MLESLLILMCYCKEPVAVYWQKGQDINLRAYSKLEMSAEADRYFRGLCRGEDRSEKRIQAWSLDRLNSLTCPLRADAGN